MRLHTAFFLLLTAASSVANTSGETFKAVHLNRDGITRVTATIGDFTPAGPKLASLQPADKRLIGVTYNPTSQTWYGMTPHYVGPLNAQGKLEKMEPPESVEPLSWVGGITFDAANNRLLIATKGGDGYLYEYKIDSNSWRVIANMQGIDVEALILDAKTRMLYAVAKIHGTKGRTLAVLNQQGAIVMQNPIQGPLFYDRLSPLPQLGMGDNGLYLLTSHHKHTRVADELWQLDPMSGQASRMPYNTNLDLTKTTWPNWPGGPIKSPRVKVPVTTIFGKVQFDDASAYVTPKALTQRQDKELHVVTVQHGGLQLGEYLKKIDKLNISANGKDGLQVELKLNPDHSVQPAVVEVTVARATKPIVLALGSQFKLVWDIKPETGAKIESVYLFGRSDSVVAGVPGSRIRQGNRELAVAWELQRGGMDFDDFITSVRSETGLYESSFQGNPQAQAFSIPVGSSSH